MIRIILFLVAVALAALAAAWLVERPGEVAVTWMGWRIETSVGIAVAAVAALTFVLLLLWSVLRLLLRSPRLISHALHERRRRRGMRSLSRGLVAVASGDSRAAGKFAREADRLAGDEPLTLLLRAQTAQLAGDRPAADAAFRAMAERQDTRLLGLRGLYVEAQRRDDAESALRYAEEAAKGAQTLTWAGQAVFDFRCAAGDWAGALEALETNARGGLIDKPTYRRHRAVLLTARAMDLEASDAAGAKSLAQEAVKLAPDLVPAVTLAARLSVEAGEWRRAGKLVEAAWRRSPHPDLADIYAHLRAGDAARDRLARVQQLARLRPREREGAIAIARAAIDAREFVTARSALAPLLDQPTQRVAMLMAELEEAEHDDAGRAREWMARAVRAARDPCWTADGMVSDHWLPVSPVSGRIDAFEWKVPVAEIAPLAPALAHEDAAAMGGPAARLTARERDDAIDVAPTVQSTEPVASAAVDMSPEAAAAGSSAATAPSSPAARAAPAAAPAGKPSTPLPAWLSPAADARASARVADSRRPEAVIPLIHAPDDPGPEPEPIGETNPRGVDPGLPAALR